MAELATGPNPGTGYSVPGFSDIIHLTPRYRLTRADFIEIGLAHEARRAPNISEEAAVALEKRTAMIEQQQQSLMPGWRRKLVGVVTTLDNIQDQLATIAWISGPILNKIGRSGVILHGALTGSASAINWVEKAISGPMIGRSHKHRRALTRRADARQRKGIAGLAQRGLGWLQKSQSHLLEAAQATDTWWGVGLSLGAIFGALEETYWRTGTQALHIAQTAVNEIMADVLLTDPAKRAAARDAAAMYAAKGIADPMPPPIQWADWLWRKYTEASNRVNDWGALTYATNLAASDARLDSGDIPLLAMASARQNIGAERSFSVLETILGDAGIANLIMPPPRVRDPLSALLLQRAGVTLDKTGAPLGEYRPPTMTFSEYVGESIQTYNAATKSWLPPADDTTRNQVVHQLVEMHGPITGALITGGDGSYRDKLPPADAALMLAIEHDALPPASATRAQLEAWLAVITEAVQSDAIVNPARDFAAYSKKAYDKFARLGKKPKDTTESTQAVFGVYPGGQLSPRP